VLNGRVVVFLSCSEKFKQDVAHPVRDGLAGPGVHGVIVSEEPMLPRISGEPESKIEAYLEASDAFVALCTPDDELRGGSFHCRQNIIDEFARARSRPRLRERIQVFKEPRVQLPSNINPTFETLDINDVSPVVDLILRQLKAWGVLERVASHDRIVGVEPSASVADLIGGLANGDQEEASRRAYELLRSESREAQMRTVEQLLRFLQDATSEDGDEVHRASSILEAINRLDATLVPIDLIEDLANAQDHAKRMSAAMLLWDRATVAPNDVPLGLLGRLAQPATEDWYVQAPAIAAVKQLLLHRRAARIVLDHLSASADPEDRYAAAAALLDIAHVDLTAVPRDLVETLARDRDELVASKGREGLKVVGELPEGARDTRSPFRL